MRLMVNTWRVLHSLVWDCFMTQSQTLFDSCELYFRWSRSKWSRPSSPTSLASLGWTTLMPSSPMSPSSSRLTMSECLFMCICLCHASGTINLLQIFTTAMLLSSGSNIKFTMPDDTFCLWTGFALICTSRCFPGRHFTARSLFESCSELNMPERLRLIDYLFVSLPVML